MSVIMSKSKGIILRVQSRNGTQRIEVDSNTSLSQVYEKTRDAFGLSGFGFSLYRERSQKDELVSSRSKTIKSQGLKHGDMIYLVEVNGALLRRDDGSFSNVKTTGDGESSSPVSSSTQPIPQTSTAAPRNQSLVSQEDDVDLQLWKLDGKVQRNKDNKLCHHGANGCCVHCSPLEPFDEAYLREHNVKHMSFHSYLRKLTAGVDRGKFVNLEDISCRIKSGCKDHPPWPQGICSKCQPNAITLNRQAYRHIDNVMFENPSLVERFLNYWRSTGHQRIGFLYGKYEIHSDVPLGIRAVVAAIYEPPQTSTRDSVSLLPDEKAETVETIASKLGLRRVGWIFTDLVADDVNKGTVKHVRNIKSHFLSAQECIMAGYFQNQNPNTCRFSPNGYFGSKFVTVCVTGDSSNQVHMEGYQVSNQCMALVRDDCLVPTLDAPELGYVRKSTDKQYVPDVYYKENDNYGNEVLRLARPLPVEYLLVDVPASTPLTPLYTFHVGESIHSFPVENRLIEGQIQDFNALSSYIQQFQPHQFLKAASDFHFLLYVSTMETLPLMGVIDPLISAVLTQNSIAAMDWSNSEEWATVDQLIAASSSSHPRQSRTDKGTSTWTCPLCTYMNPDSVEVCEMCSTAR